MIDTIVFRCFLALLPEMVWLSGWQGWWPRGQDAQPFNRYDNCLKHSLLGIRLYVRENIVNKIEVDLPKLLFGHNGRLIKIQAELDCAFARLKRALQTVCQPLSPDLGYYPGDLVDDERTFFTRIDPVWQFDLIPVVVFNALRTAKHPEIDRMKSMWEGETLVFPGTKLRISLYDKKLKEHAKCEHNVLRAEVQLRDGKIDQHFAVAKNSTLTHLTIETVYTAYRSVLLGFGTIAGIAQGEGGIEDFLAWVVTKLPDLDVIGQYGSMKPVGKRQLTGLRTEVGNRVLRLLDFSWAKLLPETGLPPVVEIVNEAKEKKVNALFELLGSSPVPAL